MMPMRTNHQGFTLLELIVVMVLIGITASFALPQFGGFVVADELKTTTRRLIGLFHQTAGLARSEQRAYLLSYHASAHSFTVEPQEVPEQPGEQRASPKAALQVASNVVIKDVWTWFGQTRDTGNRSIRFSAEGYIEPTIVYLGDAQGRTMSLILSPFLGKVQVVDKYVVPDPKLFAQ
jgi:general secretion pathway protein H